MQTLTTVKTKTQEGLTRLVEVGKQQPPQVQLWAGTAAAAVVGGIAVAAVAKGVLAVVALLSAPPIAFTVGALGGGALGWSLMQQSQPAASPTAPFTATGASDVLAGAGV